MDVVEVLRRASDVVDRAGVAADLRSVAFSTAVDLILRDPSAALPGEEARPLDSAADRHPGRHLDRQPVGQPGRGHDAGRTGDERVALAHDVPDGLEGLDGLDAGAYDLDDAPSASVSRLGAVPSSSTAAHRSATGPRVAARIGDRGADRDPPFGASVGAGRAGRPSDRLVAVRPPRSPSSVADDPWGHIADALGVRPELLDRVWEERGGRLQLAGDPSRFGPTRAQRVGTAAVLLLAALRWSGRDGGEPVPDAVVRTEIERLGLLDTGNYTKHLAGRRQLLSTTGSGRTATYKLRYDGLEEARTIAQALLEDS